MRRLKMTLEYDGTGLVGWQWQENGLSVQQILQQAIEKFCGERVSAVAAGRTDAGVHATGQVVHIDLDTQHAADQVMAAINYHMRPHAVGVVACEQVAADFHARFSASRRHYRYRLINRRARLVLDQNRAWQVAEPLDAAAMNLAAGCLLGRHDFTSFRAAGCQAKSPVRTLDQFNVVRREDEISFDLSARSFLHSQVRAMVGSLVQVGRGKWRPGDMGDVLAARDRKVAGPTAPACGLYLVAVDYDTVSLRSTD